MRWIGSVGQVALAAVVVLAAAPGCARFGKPPAPAPADALPAAATEAPASPVPAARMEVVGAPEEVPAVQREVQDEVDAAEGRSWPLIGIERYAFYERAKEAYAVIQTGERRFYGCFAFRKGVIPPEA